MQGWSRKSFLNNVFLLASGTAAGQLAVIAASPLVTRLYTPQDVGILTVFSAITMILSVAVGLRFQYAIPLPESEAEATNLLALSLLVVLLCSAGIAAGLPPVERYISQWAGFESLGIYVWLVPVGTCAIGVYSALSQWAVRRGDFRRVGRTKLTQGFSNVCVTVGAGLLGIVPVGLLLGQIAGQAAGIRTLTSNMSFVRVVGHDVSKRAMFRAASRYRRFATVSTPGGLLNSCALHAPALIVASFYGNEVAGLFGITERVLCAPVTMISNSVAQVFFGEAAIKARDADVDQLNRLAWRTAARLAVVGLVPTILVVIGAPFLFRTVFGSDWQVAGRFAQFLAVAYWAQFVASPLAWLNHVLERHDITLLWNGFRLILVAGVLIAFGVHQRPAMEAVACYAGAVVISYIVLLAALHHALHRRRMGKDPSVLSHVRSCERSCCPRVT